MKPKPTLARRAEQTQSASTIAELVKSDLVPMIDRLAAAVMESTKRQAFGGNWKRAADQERRAAQALADYFGDPALADSFIPG